MKLFKALALLASTGYLTIVLSSPLVHHLGYANDVNDGYVNATPLPKRKETISAITDAISHTRLIYNLNADEPSQFTIDVVTTLQKNFPGYNYVICKVKHDYHFEGTQGTDWDNAELALAIGRSLGFVMSHYDIVYGGAGNFTRYKDGGFKNWAYDGNVASRTDTTDSATVVFNAP